MSKNALIISTVVLLVLVGSFVLLSQKPQSPTAKDVVLGDSTSTTGISPSLAPQITSSVSQAPKMTELKIEDLKVGAGREVKSGDIVVMHYTGTLTNGTKFDSSLDRGQPFTTQIGVGQVIEGWDKGVPGMKIGGKRRLSIPSAMAYGSRGAGGVIPPDADLIFEVELVNIK